MTPHSDPAATDPHRVPVPQIDSETLGCIQPDGAPAGGVDPDSPDIRAALKATGDVVYDWDLISDCLRLESHAGAALGLAPVDLPRTGEALQALIHRDDLPSRLSALTEHYRSGETIDIEYRVQGRNGVYQWLQERAAATVSDDGRPVRLHGVLRVVESRKRREAQLRRLAHFDEGTGLINRNRLREVLHQTIQHSSRYGLPGALLIIGVDKLGMVNESYGHQTADAVLTEVAARLRDLVRDSDVVGRMDGDGFGLILGNCRGDGMERVADSVLTVLRDHPVHTPTGPLHITASIGGVQFPDLAGSADEAITRAEAALHDAKRTGRDGFRRYRLTEAQRTERRQSLTIGELVQDALNNHRVLLAFQPLVRAGRRDVAAYECLMRVRQSDGTILPASLVMPVVEHLGLARTVDRRVLHLALEVLANDPSVTLAVNISGYTSADHVWLHRLVGYLHNRPDLAQRLTVEITETAAIQDIDETAAFVRSVRDVGCRVALDDFGAGYTSFRHLKLLSVDEVKIDGSFVEDVATNRDNRMFVRTLVGLAHTFGLQTVAEFVGSEDCARIVEDEGVDLLQGFHFGRPRLILPEEPGDLDTTGAPVLPATIVDVAKSLGQTLEHWSRSFAGR